MQDTVDRVWPENCAVRYSWDQDNGLRKRRARDDEFKDEKYLVVTNKEEVGVWIRLAESVWSPLVDGFKKPKWVKLIWDTGAYITIFNLKAAEKLGIRKIKTLKKPIDDESLYHPRLSRASMQVGSARDASYALMRLFKMNVPLDVAFSRNAEGPKGRSDRVFQINTRVSINGTAMNLFGVNSIKAMTSLGVKVKFNAAFNYTTKSYV